MSVRIGDSPWISVSLCLMCVSLAGCSGEKKKYGPDYDNERIKRGIPPIGPEGHTMSDWGLFWNYDLRLVKGRYYKRVEVRNGELVSETDAYKSGVHFTTSDGRQAYEYLQVTYSYESERRSTNPWSAVHYFENGTNRLHSLAEIEELLQSWEVDRLKIGCQMKKMANEWVDS